MVIVMSALNYIVTKLKSGVLTFINAIILANREYPYHDHVIYEAGVEPISYVVGSANVSANGSQRKLFVSKSTLIYCNKDITVRFNDANNVLVTIPAAVTPIEFHSNIYNIIIVSIGVQGTLHIWCEGVLPDEARSSE